MTFSSSVIRFCSAVWSIVCLTSGGRGLAQIAVDKMPLRNDHFYWEIKMRRMLMDQCHKDLLPGR